MPKLQWAVDENFWSSNANLIFIPSGRKKFTKQNIDDVLQFFFALKMINAAIIYDNFKGSNVDVKKFDLLSNTVLDYNASVGSEILFPDQLKNLNGYKYKLIAKDQYPRMKVDVNGFRGPDVLFMDVVKKIQNASMSIRVLDSVDTLELLMPTGMIDVFLNTHHFGGTIMMNKFFKTIQTFDTTGYCVLATANTLVQRLKYLMANVEHKIWILLAVTVLISAVVWKIYKRFYSSQSDFDSAGYFVFGIIASVCQQSIRFRRNRPMLSALTQVFVFSMMVLAEVNQSLLFSLLSERHFEKKILTVEELIQNDYHFMIDSYAVEIIKESKLYSNINSSTLDYESLEKFVNDEINLEKRLALILRCDIAEKISNFSDQNWILLSEKFISTYDTLLSGRFSPFNQRLNEISLEIFESGIKQHWPILLKESVEKQSRVSKQNVDFKLKLEDLTDVFFIYGFGLTVAMLCFIFELFWLVFLHLWASLELVSTLKKNQIFKRLNRKNRRVYPLQFRASYESRCTKKV